MSACVLTFVGTICNNKSMQIRTMWGKRPESYPGEYAPELMVAWDEHCLEDNWDGYEAEKQRAADKWGADLVESRELLIDIPDSAIEEIFRVQIWRAVVSGVGE